MSGSIDGIHLACSLKWDDLKESEPIDRIRSDSHIFNGCNLHNTPNYKSLLRLTLHPEFELQQFNNLERQLPGIYAITQAELAFDIRARSIIHARRKLFWLAKHIGKRNHQRDYVDWVVKEDQRPPNGMCRLPTIYLEDATSRVRLKVYVRHVKRPEGRFSGQLVVRIEFTLKDKEAIMRHLGGNTIDDLLNADLNAFLEQNLFLASINRQELGRLVVPDKVSFHLGSKNQTGSTRSWAEVGAMRLLKRSMDTNPIYAKKPDTWINREMAKCIRENPAFVKSQLKARRKKPSGKRFTDYRIGKCINVIPLK